jgi:3-hydroxyisobutyrate dehydrogenase-like beta-hydroxyacid dehydrogenase
MGVSVLGVIGLGRMGHPISLRLMQAGYSLVVFDSDPKAVDAVVAAGATSASDPAGVASAADIVIVCLPTPSTVEDVVLGTHGVIEGNRAGYLVDISTTGTKVARTIGDAFAKRGKIFVDAPMTGGVAGAKSGALTMIVGAPPEALAAVRPVIETIGNKIVVAGMSPGDGQMLKAINNLLSFVALEATAEAMALGVRYGLDASSMLETFNAGTGRNSATEEKFPRSVMPRSFDFGFPVKGVSKDIGLALSEAESLGVPMPVSRAAQQIWAIAMAEMADDDMTAIVKIFERWTSIEIKGNPDRAA